MKNVVLLAPYFLPRRRVGAWRPFKFAIHLREFGWQPHIITIQNQGGKLTPRENRLLSDVSVFEIESPLDLTDKIGRQLNFNGTFTAEKRTSSESSSNSLKPALDWIDKHFPVDTWLPLFLLRRKKIERYIKSVDPELLWSTGDPWSSHWLAEKLAEKYNLPWVADFRDPWTLGDVSLKNRSEFVHRIDQRQEKKVVRKASMLTFTSQETRRLYERQYGSLINKSSTIHNSFDSALFNDKRSKDEYFDDAHLNLIFFGKFRPLSPAKPFIELFHRLKTEHAEVAEGIRMYSFGSLSKEEEALAKAKGVYKNFGMFKPIALENALSILPQADILWLSTHPRREHIIPAKLWDYLAAKRPILSVAPNPEIEKILEATGAGIQFDVSDTRAILSLLCKAVCAKKECRPLPIATSFDEQAIKQYDADIATGKLADIFDRLT